MKNTRVAEIVYDLDKKCFQIWIKPPFTYHQIKRILKGLLESDLHDVQVELE